MASTRREWAEDDEFDDPNSLPQNEIINNPDGTKTTITYRLLENGKKIKTTRKIKISIIKERVNPRVAERREWAKFGKEKGHGPGPDLTTTTIGENIIFKPSPQWKAVEKEEESTGSLKTQLKDKKVSCRICQGDHFTARCPFKDTLAPVGEAPPDESRPDSPDPTVGVGGAYVPPHQRNKGKDAGPGSSFNSGRERDDLATLRVTNLSEFAEENDLRDMFDRFGRVTRVFLAKDRETGRAKGFAFVSYQDRMDAQRACEKMDGFGYGHLILKVEFAKRSQ
ncbi:eukaryotic translation initiation factor 3 subunit G [Drechslerella stenobrocha 248]|uniref:Eukaryotic translation initiation factor 3 subunit G n=1 Tax=Drechslerella stenobrocha 248 TaxID=1043628 RepID=W7IE04_9PEZI|nr:eukaryotic translation initiation factor 3 subunit G [Drechslerella stenobrocha 248]